MSLQRGHTRGWVDHSFVEVDKKTGEWDVKKKWMGIFPAKLDS